MIYTTRVSQISQGRRTPTERRREALWHLIEGNGPGVGESSAAGAEPRFGLSSATAHRIVRRGVTGAVLEPLAELLEIGPTQLAPLLGVDRTTARRYAQQDQYLPAGSVETVLRLAELEGLAQDVFETEHAAHEWLKAEHPSLEGESPLQAAGTSFGAQRVREILAAIKYGAPV